MRWLGMVAGLLLIVALVGGVGAMAYQAGLEAHAVVPAVQTLPPGAEGGTVIVRGMYPGYGYGYGWGGWHPFGFLHFIFFFLFVGFIFKLFAFGFRGGRHGGHWGGPGGGRYEAFEEAARRRHDEWHGAQSAPAAQPSGSEPPSSAASA